MFKSKSFSHATESNWNLKPFFKPKLKPKYFLFICHPEDRPEALRGLRVENSAGGDRGD